MQPILTAEMRWFYKGDLPEKALQRFWSGDLSTGEVKREKRIDFYLYLPGVDGIGIKFRVETNIPENATNRIEVKLEVKNRQRENGVIPFLTGVTGRLEYWSKSEFNGESTNPQRFITLREKSEAWISV